MTRHYYSSGNCIECGDSYPRHGLYPKPCETGEYGYRPEHDEVSCLVQWPGNRVHRAGTTRVFVPFLCVAWVLAAVPVAFVALIVAGAIWSFTPARAGRAA